MMKEKKVSANEELRFSNEKAVFDKPVKAQHGDIHKIVAQGVTIEFTDRMSVASSAYKDAPKPKQWFVLGEEGGVRCLGHA